MVSRRALVIGDGIEGIQAALDLADAKIEVTLAVEDAGLTAGDSPSDITFIPQLLRVKTHPHINLITNASVMQVKEGKNSIKSTIIQRPRFVDPERCVSCGRCVEACPVVNIPGVKSRKAIHQFGHGLKSLPSACHVHKEGLAPCSAACPAGVNPHGYIALISQGKLTEALDLITQAVAFPRVLGRVCNHPCEKVCTRGKVDQPISICALKRFAADASSSQASLIRSQYSNAKSLNGVAKVAIIGAGPAGLTAARDLARLGHRSTVFEALPSPGGMITVGMPRFRLPREVRQADIDDIVKLGIEIKTSTPIGKDLTLEDLKKKGYEAILIATGAHKNQKLGIAGETLSGVIDSIALLQALNLKQPISVGKKIIVVGGGYTAIDSARTAVRLSCEKVTILYRRSLNEMPANAEEVAEAQEEGVEIQYLVAPVRIIGENGVVTGVECQRMGLGEPDASGRRRPVPVGDSEFTIEADTVIVAVGQRPDLSFLGENTELTGGGRHIVVDRHTMATKVPGIFAAGDVIGETGTMIEAIAWGRKAAVYIDKFLRGEELKEVRPPKEIPAEVDLSRLPVPEVARQEIPLLPLKDRVRSFEEVDQGFSSDAAIKEAQRCLNCGGCSECYECVRSCELDALNHDAMPQQFDVEADVVIAAEKLASKLPLNNIYTLPSGNLSRASATAARVMAELSQQRISKEERCSSAARSAENTLPAAEPRTGVFICKCGGNISNNVDIPALVNHFSSIDDIVLSSNVDYACSEPGLQKMQDVIRHNELNRVVVAACSCCNLDQICFSCSDRRIICKTKLQQNMPANIRYEFVNIREQCAWVHRNQSAAATDKARLLISAAVARLHNSGLSVKKILGTESGALIAGDCLSGLHAAANLLQQGFPVTLLRNSSEFDSQPQDLIKEIVDKGVDIFNQPVITGIEPFEQGYRVQIEYGCCQESATAGAIIFALDRNAVKSMFQLKKTHTASLPQKVYDKVRSAGTTNSDAQGLLRNPWRGIFIIGNVPDNQAEDLGLVAATRVAVFLGKEASEITPTLALVDVQRCRGCGTCVALCPSQAVSLREDKPGVFTAVINTRLCLGCGICVAHCPSSALSQSGNTDRQIVASLEAILVRG